MKREVSGKLQEVQKMFKDGVGKALYVQSNLALDIAAIPPPSFASSPSCVWIPARFALAPHLVADSGREKAATGMLCV